MSDDLANLDKEVNKWLAENKIAAKSATVTASQIKVQGVREPSHKAITKSVAVFCSAVLYD
ncbi:MAG: hypothetical protein IOC90_09960 [Methylocystis sp.]|nr:hypothetical protein [Methylocystis sp.]MCA3584115.1 hypothetical protein [Methylocystis sp.]MCA3588342.1 hypothetical protein [Methylocystis sp.]MCA3591235.1 hypothetical protein [Methylocystis sp.]